MWREVANDRALSIWSGHKLVGLEGSPISILGTATIDVQMSSVSLDETFHIPADSEMELVATIQNGDCLESYCMVEGVQKLSVAVANAIVTPRKYDSELLQVPL